MRREILKMKEQRFNKDLEDIKSQPGFIKAMENGLG